MVLKYWAYDALNFFVLIDGPWKVLVMPPPPPLEGLVDVSSPSLEGFVEAPPLPWKGWLMPPLLHWKVLEGLGKLFHPHPCEGLDDATFSVYVLLCCLPSS